ncbi:MAG: hypothetical protein IKG56_00170 [Clostridia bacterium]|nr:hypothetical protein [Clostridia bacterium]
MKKKIAKIIGIIIFLILIVVGIYNSYYWIVSGKQNIRISTSTNAYVNSDLYVSIIAQKDKTDLETKSQIELLDSKGKRVKNVNVKYDGNNAILSIPDIEKGTYYIKATVSSKAGKDQIEKEIYLSESKQENTIINLDKGIYKPGDTVNYRALLTKKENDEPVNSNVNISIYDGNDNRVYNEDVTTSEYGIVSGSFKLADEVNSGLYKLTVKTKSSETVKQFKVNPYITPKYEVKINYDKENYIVGDTAKININTKYFFGEIAQNTQIKVFIDDNEYKTLKTDEQGNASVDYKINGAKEYKVKVEAVDSSNYYVEENSSFTAGTDIFEIKLMPEYGNLVSNTKNNVYVFTNKTDGTPLKAYVTVSSDKFTKQIATDENGIGSFQIDVEQSRTSSNYYNSEYYNNYTKNNPKKTFTINAQDEIGNKVNKSESIEIEQKAILVSTDKVKYRQGEDIKIKTISDNENAYNIYFFKNNKLIKMITSDSSETTVNLDNTYGLIDVYVTKNNGSNGSGSYGGIVSRAYYPDSAGFKRTIFIKPDKELKINLATDKDEYKPGENISISINTSDEKNSNAESALLVSMLDNAVLNLASNDLSIDNIKMALQDIKFTDELDAATLYSSIINDNSEQTIMALLLKQSDRNISVSETSQVNYEKEEKSALITIISLSIVVIITLIYLSIRFKKFRNLMKHIITFLILDFALLILIYTISEEVLWNRYSEVNPVAVCIASTIVSLLLYIPLISRINDKLYRTSISIVITVGLSTLLLFLFEFFVVELEISPLPILFIIGILFVIGVIVLRVGEIKNTRISKYSNKITKELIFMLKFMGALILSSIISIAAGVFISRIFRIYDTEFIFSIIIILTYVLNYLFNNLKSNNEKQKNGTSIGLIVLSFFAIIGVLGTMFLMLFIITGASSSTVKRANLNSAESNYEDFMGGGIPTPGAASASAESKSSLTDGASSLVGEVEDMMSSSKKSRNTNEITNETQETAKEENNTEVDENVRNVFLESMCFIPDLVTQNGSAKVDLKLSDNITTWTIQTVGNTKDGRIGYGTIDNVRVFKDFFVDFELPKNMIETDNIAIPVTIYNYTENQINATLKVSDADWYTINNKELNISVNGKSTSMTYIPISVTKSGDNKFRVEVSSENLTDIVEKQATVSPKGYKVEKVVSTGRLDGDINEDILFLENYVKDTAKAKVKIYPSAMAQTIEGMENIFQMPTGCFEQISSSLYPNILALKYLEDNGIVNQEIKDKALSYISSGYQKLLTYEVKGESGGYSLYGHSPAETVLTAYGLMEISDLSKVYSVDNSVIDKMTAFLYKKQNVNGSFTITGSHVGGANYSSDELALNAYITWALSESNPKDERLNKSIEYLKSKLSKTSDNYTLALIANALINVGDNSANDILKILANNINLDGNRAYLTSNVMDYYGTRSNVQNLQTVALTSMAFSKSSYSRDNNRALINYIISQKDRYGTWYSTQATILALKAINQMNEKGKLENQTVKVKVNSEEKTLDIKDNSLDIYEFTFDKLSKENKLNIDIEKGDAYYEVVEEYYIPYEEVDTSKNSIEVSVECNNNLKVNEILQAKIRIVNRSNEDISNGMITISIPQGFTVVEESLSKLQTKGIIEKYEMTYNKVNLYIREFTKSQMLELDTWFRASYPVEITGLDVRAYDYYNPDVEGMTKPVEIKVN